MRRELLSPCSDQVGSRAHTFSNEKGEWDVHRLWELAQGLPIFEREPESFREWEGYSWGSDVTLSQLAEHVQRILLADLSFPIILAAEGYIMDGNHRLVKAWLAGLPVKTVRFEVTPEPDRARASGAEIPHEAIGVQHGSRK